MPIKANRVLWHALALSEYMSDNHDTSDASLCFNRSQVKEKIAGHSPGFPIHRLTKGLPES
jgi:hypothetical protein